MGRLKINILRGKNKIGENLIEITDGTTTILLECGIPLNETEETKRLSEEILAYRYDMIVITHCHIDHAGLLTKDVCADKIVMGKNTFSILQTANMISENNAKKVVTFLSDEPFSVGELTVKPYLCDHSAYDSYMISVSCRDETVLYTGDFRSTGRKNFDALLSKLPRKIDCLITEGTNLSRVVSEMSEYELETEATTLLQEYKKAFILQSVTNVDRAVSFYKATAKNKKPYILNYPMAFHYRSYDNIPDTTFRNCYTYLSKGINDSAEHKKITDLFGNKLLSKKDIVKLDGFSMQIQANMSNYFLKLKEEDFDFQNSVLIYSMWHGYKQTFAEQIVKTCETLNIKIVDLHLSGHANKKTIDKLIDTVQPKNVICVHQDNVWLTDEKIQQALLQDRFAEAVQIAITYRQCGVSLLQRKMNIRYFEAKKYNDQMRAFGFLGGTPVFGSQKCLIVSLKDIDPKEK